MGWKQQQRAGEVEVTGQTPGLPGGWTGWFLARMRSRRSQHPRLELLERISLAPHHSLALVEAEGRRFLVATSAEGGPAFYPLDENACASRNEFSSELLHATARPEARPARVSW